MLDGERLAIGLISGTSMDGIDAALIETDGVRIKRRGSWLTHPYPPDLRARLLALAASPDAITAGEADGTLAAIEHAVTVANAAAVEALLRQAGIDRTAVQVIGLHGQTVLHRPEQRSTRQLGDGAALAKWLGVTVVDRFRHADVAAGGQGAPLVPLYHRALAADVSNEAGWPIAVLNLGGVANVTWIDGERLLAFDTGPASALIDDWVRLHTGAPYDDGGRIAASGLVQEERLAALLRHPHFDRPPPKSLDRHDFPLRLVEGLDLADGAATLSAFTVRSVDLARRWLPRPPTRWLVTGGGRHNAHLMAGLRRALEVPVEPVERVGWDGDALEAQCFGFLAVRSLRGLPLSLPETTGVPAPMTGGVRHDP